MKRLLLLSPTTTYKISDFLKAAYGLGESLDVVVANEERSSVEHLSAGHLMWVPLDDKVEAVRVIAQAHRERPFDAVVPVDAKFVEVAAMAAVALGLKGNDPEAVRLADDKLAMRRRFSEAGVAGPTFWEVALDIGRDSGEFTYPCVLKPRGLSGSRGVIRANNDAEFDAAFSRIVRLIRSLPESEQSFSGSILVESYLEGEEVAVEGLLSDGELEVLAIFDKPDPLVGPFFEETIYVTPSRHSLDVQAGVRACVSSAAAAMGLSQGPVHAEVRLTSDGPRILEVAARSIGGLCARTLTFATGASLEEVILRHALGMCPPLRLRREAAGVMMIPIPEKGVLLGVDESDARGLEGVVDIVITHPLAVIEPLPEGSSYLGFIFCVAKGPREVEDLLREAHELLKVAIDPLGVV